MTSWVSVPDPMVDASGDVPAVVLAALAGCSGVSSTAYAHRQHLRDFLGSTCLELAESRAQVVADRAELDRLRAVVAQEESHRLEAQRLRDLQTMGGPAPATTNRWINTRGQL